MSIGGPFEISMFRELNSFSKSDKLLTSLHTLKRSEISPSAVPTDRDCYT